MNLHELHNDLLLLPERIKFEKVGKLLTNLHDETECVIHIRNSKQALNHGLILKKVHRLIKFNQRAWLKPYIDINTNLRQKAKNNFEKNFFKLMNNAVFGKTMENVTKHRNIKTCNNRKEKKLFSIRTKLSHYKVFHRKCISNRNEKKSNINEKYQRTCLFRFINLDLSKIVMYEFRYDYVKRKYDENAKLCYMDTGSFIVHVKTDGIYKDIAEDVKKRFDT